MGCATGSRQRRTAPGDRVLDARTGQLVAGHLRSRVAASGPKRRRSSLRSAGWRCKRFAVRSAQLGEPPVPAGRLYSAVGAFGGACSAWRQAAGLWQMITSDTRSPLSAATRETDDLVLRMGRLVFQNREWTPARDQMAPLRAPASLAPGSDGLIAVLGAVHRLPTLSPGWPAGTWKQSRAVGSVRSSLHVQQDPGGRKRDAARLPRRTERPGTACRASTRSLAAQASERRGPWTVWRWNPCAQQGAGSRPRGGLRRRGHKPAQSSRGAGHRRTRRRAPALLHPSQA